MKLKRESWQTWSNYAHAAVQTQNFLQAARGILQVTASSWCPPAAAAPCPHRACTPGAQQRPDNAMLLARTCPSSRCVRIWCGAAVLIGCLRVPYGTGRLEQGVAVRERWASEAFYAQVLAQSGGQRGEEDLVAALVAAVADTRRAAGTYGVETPGTPSCQHSIVCGHAGAVPDSQGRMRKLIKGNL